MLRKRKLLVSSIVVLTIFFSLSIYFMYSIDDYNSKVKTEYNIEFIEDVIKLKAANLPKEYLLRNVISDDIVNIFFKNLIPSNGVHNLNKLWREANKWTTENQIFDSNYPNLGNVIKALKTAKILIADVYSKGTQLKLLLHLEGNQLAVFKPQWYDRDRIILGDVYAGKDRYGSEILAFYLAGILDLRLVPLVTERIFSIKKEIAPVATHTLNSTIFVRNNKTCMYGKCFYCKREDPVCENEEGKLRGAILLHISGNFKTYRSPWQRTYKKGKQAAWESQPNYCMSVKAHMSNKRLLDLIDVSIFDFLIQNGDRHHYETLNDKVVFVDNGKGLGNPHVHHIDILAPLYQCCVIRSSTWERLKILSGGYLRELLESIQEVKNVVASAHLKAIEERLLLVYATVESCRSRNKINYL